MTFAAGTRVGPYEIVAPIGAGGMGEVYRARDYRLDRAVALKILPSSVVTDQDRRRRFEHEARATSALNHPNILTVHDLGVHEGTPYLVAELLEGEDLRTQLDHGPLALRTALEYAQQMATGLAAAHAKGITHRDLKPENVFITADGRLKILDFGLARIATSDAAGSLQRTITTVGSVVGTVGYMSPEQVRGGEIDHRSDLFSFGVVLYEMLSGKRPFSGESAVETMNAILKDEPGDLAAMNPPIHPAVEKTVRRCLEKNPERRFQSAHDLGFALDALTTLSGSRIEPPAARLDRPQPSSRTAPLAWSIAALSLLTAIATIAFAVSSQRRPASDARAIRASMTPPGDSGVSAGMQVSPDGRLLVARGPLTAGKGQLWVRPIDDLSWRSLAGTEGGGSYFWSPDSRSIGFFAGGKLKRIDAAGGPVLTLADAPAGRGGSWSRQGVIVFAPSTVGPLSRVADVGGVTTEVTILRPGENGHRWPVFLPDGQRFLYLASDGVRLASLDAAEVKTVLPQTTAAIYAQGHLFFTPRSDNRTLMAQPFDVQRFEPTGTAFPLAEGVSISQGRGMFSVSEQGLLVYETEPAVPAAQLAWFDRKGLQIGRLGEPGVQPNIHLSPDEKSVAAQIVNNDRQDIWLYDVARGVRMRFTENEGGNREAVWSPDGMRLVYNAYRKGIRQLMLRAVDGASAEEMVVESNVDKYPTSWSQDGRHVLYYSVTHPKTGSDLWVVPMTAERKPYLFLQTEYNEDRGQFSLDGRWIVYVSDESGGTEIYVAAFPGPGGKKRISAAGGDFPRWRRDGKEIFYLAPDNRLMAVSIDLRGGALTIGSEQALFDTIPASVSGGYPYDVSADGQRFLVNTGERRGAPPITLLVNWIAARAQ